MKAMVTIDGLVINDERGTTLRFNNGETSYLKNLLCEDSAKQVIWHDIPSFIGRCVRYPHPEIVHVELTRTCNESCDYCYTKFDRKDKELTKEETIELLKELAEMEIFQITLGGGEPTLSLKLEPVVFACKDLQLPVTMTTNGTSIRCFSEILKYLKQVNVSYKNDTHKLYTALSHLKVNDVKSGINLIAEPVCRLPLDEIVELSNKYKAPILVLAKKNFDNFGRPLFRNDNIRLARELIFVLLKKYNVEGLFCDSPCINQCFAAKRFCTISPSGEVYPCSFVRKSWGNVRKQSFKTIWKTHSGGIECPFFDIGNKLEKRRKNS